MMFGCGIFCMFVSTGIYPLSSVAVSVLVFIANACQVVATKLLLESRAIGDAPSRPIKREHET